MSEYNADNQDADSVETQSQLMEWEAITRDKLRIFYYVFVPIVGATTLFNLVGGFWVVGGLEAIVCMASIVTFLYSKRINTHLFAHLSVGYITVVTFTFLFFPALGNSAYLWSIGLPFIISYLVGSRATLYWGGGFFVGALAIGVSLLVQGEVVYWTWDKALFIAVPYIAFLILSVSFSRYIENYIRLMQQTNKKSQINVKGIEQQESDYSALLHSSMNAMAVNQDRKWAYANPACLELFGALSLSALKGKPMIESIHPDSREVVRRRTRQLKENKESLPVAEQKFLRMDGSMFIGEVSSSPILFNGKLSNLITIRDVTALKKYEEEQKEREQKDHEERLSHTQRLGSLGILAGGIAHDFNNLIAVISGNAELLRMLDSKDKKAEEHINQIDESCIHAADLCKQMLAYAGMGKVVVSDVELTMLVKSMGSLIRSTVGRHISIHTDLLNDSVDMIEADASQIKQVVLNFIMNAVDAIGSDSGEISLRTYTQYVDSKKLQTLFNGENIQEGKYTVFEISDTGCGIAEALQPKIFDPFFTTKESGSGLGLSAVLGIVQGHQGGLEMYTKEGVGTRFRVYFPALEHEKDVVTSSGETSDEEQCLGGGLVMVVDDEVAVQEVLTGIVQALNFEVLSANDGEQALVEFKKSHQDLKVVLMDVSMPKMGGMEAMAEMRKINDSVPIILLSGYTEQNVVGKEGKSNPDVFINKPFRMKDVKAALNKTLGL